ncbi:hypothetical protein J2S03_000066 [Alicyclobacillus cycloheptanicus]|uniref:Uncharacterized protein n=1 Tax=Alicyclobacillus cycloheptanicus TaxID=1457 RepID=A0ABT9XD95_9BACL|nr:hypothetical protein [Alicyclobacillus cycloheptanicus]
MRSVLLIRIKNNEGPGSHTRSNHELHGKTFYSYTLLT